MNDKEKKEKTDPKTKDELERKAEAEQKKHHAAIKPDPETLGPDPQEKMEGPVSSIVKKIAEAGDGEKDEDEDDEKKDARKKKDDKS